MQGLRNFHVLLVLVCIGFMLSRKQEWKPLGGPLFDVSGAKHVSLSADGTVVAILGRLDTGGNVVQVYQYSHENKTWKPKGTTISEATDMKLSPCGNSLVIGTYRVSSSFRVYDYKNGDWKQRGSEITLPGNATPQLGGAEFVNHATVAAAVSLSNNTKTIAIGSPNAIVNGHERAGLVRVYDWFDDGNDWKQRGIDADLAGRVEDDNFGVAVDLSDDALRVAVGAYESTPSFRFPGHAAVFEWDGGVWKQIGQKLVGSTEGELFGVSASLSGDGRTVAVGAPYSNTEEGGHYAGQARVFRWNQLSSRWAPMGQPLNGGANYNERDLGRSLELSSNGENLCVVSVKTLDEGGITYDGGIARDVSKKACSTQVYKYVSGVWLLIDRDIVGKPKTSWASGCDCSLSREGETLATGEPAQVLQLGTAFKLFGHFVRW